MNDDLVYVKTPQGHEEIAQRRRSLTPAQRHLLIMVDGKRTVAESKAKLSAFGNVPVVFEVLESLGLIAPLNKNSAAQGGATAANAGQGPASAVTVLPFSEAKAEIKKMARQYLGGGATLHVVALEETSSYSALLRQASRCRQTITERQGQEQAEAFWQRARQLLPADIAESNEAGLFVNI